MINPRESILRIKPYVPGKSVADLMRSKGISDAVKLSSNENPLGPSPAAIKAAAAAAAEAHLYPDGASQQLRSRLAQFYDLPEEHFIMGCGSDEVIRMLGEAYLEPKQTAIFADVTFSQYAFVTRIMGAEEVVVPLKAGVHDLLEMAYMARKKRARICFVCNPNNPTGTYVTHDEARRFLDAVPAETLVVFDEAYIEYVEASDFPDVLSLLKEGRNVVSLRTFSKVYALAGLRVGYGIAPPQVVSNLERIRAPFNVNNVAQAAALAALDDQEHVKASREMNATERRRVAEGLKALGLTPLPSQSNFVWVELERESTPVYEALLDRGVIVRDGASFGAPTALRITIGRPSENDRLLKSLAEIVNAQMERGTVG